MKENVIRIFNVGHLDVEYHKNLNFIDEKRILERIWDKDGSLWNIDDELANNCLGWLNLPEQSKLVSKTSNSFTSGLFDNYEVVCLVGMGGKL